MNAPQITMIIILAIALLLEAHLHGKPRIGNYNFFGALIGSAITVAILSWGGFFN